MPLTLADFRPDPTDLALVVIDIQEKFIPAMQEKVLAQVVRNTNILLATAREFGLPVIVTEQYRRGLGATLGSIQIPAGCNPVQKTAFSCCGELSFLQVLEAAGRRDVVLCGLETHICVYQTALDLLEEDRRVFVALDAVCSRAKLNWKEGLSLMRQAGAVVTPTETLVFQLLGVAGDERFKRLSPLLK